MKIHKALRIAMRNYALNWKRDRHDRFLARYFLAQARHYRDAANATNPNNQQRLGLHITQD